MRPVKISNTPGYAIPNRATFTKAAIKVGLANNNIKPVGGLKSTYVTQKVLDLMNSLTFLNDGEAGWDNLIAWNKNLMIALIDSFSSGRIGYGNARLALINNYGQYCNYCGMKVDDSSLAVEHRLPKAEFPGEMVSYDNFFLACPICNSFKGSKPSYNTSENWAIKEQSIKNPKMPQIIAGGYDTQTWPDDKYAWKGLEPVLVEASSGKEIPVASAIDYNNEIIDRKDNKITALIQNYKKNPIVVEIRFKEASGKVGKLPKQLENFIKIVSLNKVSSDEKVSDRRIYNRTIAWFDALSSLRVLSTYPPDSKRFQNYEAAMFRMAKLSGYFSVWSWLFYLITQNTTGNQSVYDNYKQAVDDDGDEAYIPGTNVQLML